MASGIVLNEIVDDLTVRLSSYGCTCGEVGRALEKQEKHSASALCHVLKRFSHAIPALQLDRHTLSMDLFLI